MQGAQKYPRLRCRVEAFVGRSEISGVALGHQHTLFLDGSGGIWGCGENKEGQCGLGTSLETIAGQRRLAWAAGLVPHKVVTGLVRGSFQPWAEISVSEIHAAEEPTHLWVAGQQCFAILQCTLCKFVVYTCWLGCLPAGMLSCFSASLHGPAGVTATAAIAGGRNIGAEAS